MTEQSIPGGCMGKVLSVNLSNYGKNDREIFREIPIDPEYYEKLLTGYGLAAKIIYDNQAPGLGDLDEGNIFAVMSGLLTNTGTLFSSRWMIAGKSPLTGSWGDANSGGFFSPAIKKTGFDGFFFKGRSPAPVYLYIDDETISLKDASSLWGKDSWETANQLYRIHGHHFKIACIGPGGENGSYLAGVVTDGARLAARGGLGALMGSKHLKAICLGANKSVRVEDEEEISYQTLEYIRKLNDYKHLFRDKLISFTANTPLLSGLVRFLNKTGILDKIRDAEVERYVMQKYGTSGSLAFYSNIGFSPVKNWSGRAKRDFPTRLASKISADSVIKYNKKTFGCPHCPLACGAEVDVEKFNDDSPDDIFKLEPASEDDVIRAPHKPEYETLCSFGDMILNNSLHSIIKVNDLCNRAGIDTISCAETVAWAFDAFSHGVLTSEDTGGLELTWGKDQAGRKKTARTLVELVKRITAAKKTDSPNKSIGEALMNGAARAAAYYDAKKEAASSAYAFNAGGQELPMYDIRSKKAGIDMGLAVIYEVEPTPGRHTSSMPGVPESFAKQMTNPDPAYRHKRHFHKRMFASSKLNTTSKKTGKSPDEDYAALIKNGSCFQDIVNGCGLCNFAFGLVADKQGHDELPLIRWLQAVTGWKDKWLKHYMEIGQRIKTIRKLFNFDKCKNPEPRIIDAATGKNREEIDKVKHLYNQEMGFDRDTGRPTGEILESLGIIQMKKIEL